MSWDTFYITLGLCYAVPLVRLSTCWWLPRRFRRWSRLVNLSVGRIEWGIHCVRDTILVPLWLICLPGLLWFLNPAPESFLLGVIALPPLCLSFFAWWHSRRHRVALIHYALRHPHMDPREYFQAYFAGFGPFHTELPTDPPRLTLPILDFRSSGWGKRRFWPLIHGALSTWFMARQVLLARRCLGPSVDPAIFDGLMRIWGARLMQLGRMLVIVEGSDQLQEMRGPSLFCFTHKSALDFAVAPAVLGLVDLPSRRPFSIRFLAARDHFLDNWFLYRLLGIGRAIEAAGMIFVDRLGSSEERRRAVDDAVGQLLGRGVDLAIYPQGTRAPGSVGPRGERLDAGYFTTGGRSRLAKFGGHVKKGAARLAIAAARELAKDQVPAGLRVIPVGLIGTATALPKQGWRVQTGTEVRVIIGRPITVAADGVENESAVRALHEEIDRQMEALSGARGVLAARFLTDIRRCLPAEQVETVAMLLNRPHPSARLLYATIDCIYVQSPATWTPRLKALASALIQGEGSETLEDLYRQVVSSI